MIRALIFDVDGTLADTESWHLRAFNEAFVRYELPWRWDVELYRKLLLISGGKERMLHYWKQVAPETALLPGTAARIAQVHAEKTRRYAAYVENGAMPLRPGVARLVKESVARGITLAIATTTSAENVRALLVHHFGSGWQAIFPVVCDASVAPRKKPAPDVYIMALQKLRLSADDCIAFEDSENGLMAAVAAGLRTVVTPTIFTERQNFSEAMLVLPHLGDESTPLPQTFPGAAHPWIDLDGLDRWHRGVPMGFA